MALYLIGGATVFAFSGVMAMAGLGAAFLFVPLFYYLGVPLAEATSTALLLNAVSLSMATVSYARAGLIDWRAGIPVLVTAVILAPVGAALSVGVDRSILLGLFVGFLVFAGAMMLFYRPRTSPDPEVSRRMRALVPGWGESPASSGGCSGWAEATSSCLA